MQINEGILQPHMKHIGGIFIKRLNRFAALVNIDGKAETAHVPNSGRLKEILIPGNSVLLFPATNQGRKTRYTLKAVRHEGIWISIDSTAVNDIIEDALKNGRLPQFGKIKELRREAVYKGSRFDFRILEGNGIVCFLEGTLKILKKGSAAINSLLPMILHNWISRRAASMTLKRCFLTCISG